MVIEQDKVKYEVLYTINQDGKSPLRTTQVEIHYKNGVILTRCFQPHLFSEYKWSLPGKDLHTWIRIKMQRHIKKEWYDGICRKKLRSFQYLATELLEEMTDFMFDDIVENNNKLGFYTMSKSWKKKRLVHLGVYTKDHKPLISMKGDFIGFVPIIGMTNNTLDLVREQYYFKGKRYANLHIQRSLTKDRRFNGSH